MKKFLFTLLVLVLVLPAASAQNPLVIKYEGNGVIGGAGLQPSQAPEAEQDVIARLNENYLPVVVEYKKGLFGKFRPSVAWIYLNTVDDPRGYPETTIQSDYFGVINLFCINLSFWLRLKLKKGVNHFFKTLGVEYYINENGEIISTINYNKFERFV